MGLAADLDNLESQREKEFAHLRSSITTLGDSLEQRFSPSRWVRQHPYATTLSAAALGFIVTQLPGKSSSPKPAPTPATHKSSPGSMLNMLMNLAQQFLPQIATTATQETDTTISTANTGTLTTPNFPRNFTTPKA